MHSRELAGAFIEQIRRMNREMGIPEGFEEIREADLEKMAGWATQEANPLYPVPVIYDKSDVKRILMKIKIEPADQMSPEDRAIETM